MEKYLVEDTITVGMTMEIEAMNEKEALEKMREFSDTIPIEKWECIDSETRILQKLNK